MMNNQLSFLASDYDDTDDDSWYPAKIFCPGSETIKIYPDQMCDGTVNCPGALDEKNCSCLTRIDSSRLCDNVIDCPFMEDELGCPGNCFNC